MKLTIIYCILVLGLFLTACGGAEETKMPENEQKTPPATVTNSANVQNQKPAKVDSNDLPAKIPSGNANMNTSKSPKPATKDPDDINKKDADDKNRKNSNDKDGDDDDN
jgi:PBP1b-binding outer membrane lipoprotein LpoB